MFGTFCDLGLDTRKYCQNLCFEQDAAAEDKDAAVVFFFL